MVGLVEPGAAEVRLTDPPVVMEEDSDLLSGALQADPKVADEVIADHVHVILEVDCQSESLVDQADVPDQRVAPVAERPLPPGVAEPGELSVDPKAGPAAVAHRMDST